MEEVAVKRTSLMSAQKNYITNIGKGLEELIGSMNHYQAVCGYNILSAINLALAKDGLNHTSPDVDKESINDAIRFAVIYELNTDNKEVFVIVRKENRNGQWIKKIECKPQYKGTLKILKTYGRDVAKVYPEWIVRENDDFTYPSMRGVESVPPCWSTHGTTGRVRLVVVPIQYKNGYIEYRISERDSVATNIKAQIKQSLMFDKQKGPQVMELIKDMTLDELLTNETIAPYVNDTYTGLSSEEMIITKLILNAVKRVDIDYKNAFSRELYEKTFDNADVYKKSHTAAEIVQQSKTEIELKEPVTEIAVGSAQNVKDDSIPEHTADRPIDEPDDLSDVLMSDDVDFLQ